jgi:hypothetical protein
MTKDYSHISIGISSPALYNLFVIFICTILSLWIIRASKRLYRVLRVRAAILTGRLVHIWAISSSLPYFEGAIQSHIDAIVHTRQSYPPTNVKCLYIPFFVEEISINNNDNNILEFSVSITTTVPCRLWIVQNISLYLLQKSFIAYKNADNIFFNNLNDYNDIESKQLLQIYRENHNNLGKVYNTGVGLSKIVITAQNNEESNKIPNSKVALFIQPLSQNKHAFTQNTPSNKNMEIVNALHFPVTNGDIELNSFSGYDMLSNNKPVIKQSLDFGIKIISADNNNNYLNSVNNNVITPSTDELFLYCNDNSIYSAMEVFGLNQGYNQNNDTENTNNNYMQVPSPTSHDSSEDCVVCLSESQQVLLLPCRHMCVCRQCLSRIDKCPICRQTYSEHMALVIDEEKTFSSRNQNIVSI